MAAELVETKTGATRELISDLCFNECPEQQLQMSASVNKRLNANTLAVIRSLLCLFLASAATKWSKQEEQSSLL